MFARPPSPARPASGHNAAGAPARRGMSGRGPSAPCPLGMGSRTDGPARTVRAWRNPAPRVALAPLDRCDSPRMGGARVQERATTARSAMPGAAMRAAVGAAIGAAIRATALPLAGLMLLALSLPVTAQGAGGAIAAPSGAPASTAAPVIAPMTAPAQTTRGLSQGPSSSNACPPGLARKDDGCLPAASAQPAGQLVESIRWGDPARVTVGEVYDPRVVHIVTSPGRYGLAQPAPGSVYAVIGDRLVRLDDASRRVLSVLRVVGGTLD